MYKELNDLVAETGHDAISEGKDEDCAADADGYTRNDEIA